LPHLVINGIIYEEWQDSNMKTLIGNGGRLVIPSQYRKALGLKPGDEVQLVLENDEIRVISTKQAISRAQAIVRRYIPPNRDLSAELIRERRDEAKND
jgi:AbrB family looped-hinge helix DNA binding protein